MRIRLFCIIFILSLIGASARATIDVPVVSPREHTEAILDSGRTLRHLGRTAGEAVGFNSAIVRTGALFGEAFFVHEYGHIRTARSYGVDSTLRFVDGRLVVYYQNDQPFSDPTRRHLAGGGLNLNEIAASRYARSNKTGAYLVNQFYGTIYTLRARFLQQPDDPSDPINYEQAGGSSVERQFWTTLTTDLLSGRTHDAVCAFYNRDCSSIFPTFQTYYTPDGLAIGGIDRLGDYDGQLVVRDGDWSVRAERTIGPLQLAAGTGSLNGGTGLVASSTYRTMLTERLGVKLRVDWSQSHLFYNQIRAQEQGFSFYGAVRIRW